jgi:hypothetical protein
LVRILAKFWNPTRTPFWGFRYGVEKERNKEDRKRERKKEERKKEKKEKGKILKIMAT